MKTPNLTRLIASGVTLDSILGGFKASYSGMPESGRRIIRELRAEGK